MKQELIQRFRDDLAQFDEATRKYYAGEMSRQEYKGISGGFGSYSERDGKREQYYGPAEVVCELIEPHHQPAKRCCYRIKHVFFSSLGGNAPRQGPPRRPGYGTGS